MNSAEKLMKKADESGITLTALAEKTGICRQTFYNRAAGKGDFTASEINAITAAMRLTRDERDDIFFTQEVE